MFFLPQVSCMAPAFTSPSWVGAHHHLLGSTPVGLAMSFSLRKGKVWNRHRRFLVFRHQHCFQQEFLQSFTQVFPDLIPASSESQTLVPCTEPLPHTQRTHRGSSVCPEHLPEAYTALSALLSGLGISVGPCLISGALGSLAAPPLMAEPTTVDMTDHSFFQCLERSRLL